MLARQWLLSLALLTFAPGLCATPPAPTPPVEPDIILPGLDPVPPAPTPQPTPAITKLTSAELYVIEGKVPLLVLASPEGIVSVTEETGPVKVRAIFAGNQKYSTRSIKGPAVYFIEAVGTGRVELLITRTDGKGKLIRRTLDVTTAPIPPPQPGPIDPIPVPVPVVDALIAPVQTAYSADPSPTKNADRIALAAIYKAVAEQVGQIDTTGGLATVIETTRSGRIGERLKSVRAILGGELNKFVPPGKSVTMTPEMKNTFKRELSRYSVILEGLK